MPTYIKGEPVANATSYELYEKASGNYNKLAENTEINFEVSALGLGGGSHTLVVKAKAAGYDDSDYSNEVVYGARELIWYTSAVKSSAGTFPPSKLALQGSGFTYYNESTHDKYQGKTVNRIAFVPSAAGTLTIYKTNKITSGATGTVVATVTVKAEDIGAYTTYEIPDVAVGANEYIAVYKYGTDTALFNYWNTSSAYTGVEDKGMILCTIDGSYASSDKGACGFDLGYYG